MIQITNCATKFLNYQNLGHYILGNGYLKMKINENLSELLCILDGYIVGGAVRDFIMGRPIIF